MSQFKMYVFATAIRVFFVFVFFRPPVQNLQSELLKHTIDLSVALKWVSTA